MPALIPWDVRVAFALLPVAAAAVIFRSAAVFAVLYVMLCAYIIFRTFSESQNIQ
jgi:hypothetical protein